MSPLSTLPTVLYVSPDGTDDWSGRSPDPASGDGPFATPERARDEVRALKGSGPIPAPGITVYFRGGDYLLSRTFLLTDRDGGEENAPITYRPYPNERVRLLGGPVLSGFEPVRDPAVLARLAIDARPHVRQCDLRENGISDFGRFVSRGFSRPISPSHLELFFQGRRMEVARWPDDGYARIQAPAEPMAEGDGHGGPLGRVEAGFLYAGDRPSRWKALDNVWVHGYWSWDWADSYERMASFDPATGRIATHPPHGLYGIKADQRFYFLNVLEELDRPGEYCVDPGTGQLYFWPPEGLHTGEAAASVLETPLVRFTNARHLTLRGMSLCYARGNAVEVEGGSHVQIAGCSIGNVGNYGVIVEGGTGHAVRGCDIFNLGDGGVQVAGGDRRTLSPSNHEVANNHVHHTGQWSRCYQSPVILKGVGVRVTHNHIHDSPHNGILLAGNEHLVEFNHIHHVCQETGDVGAFYMGRNWTERGNVIRYNFFHHTHGPGKGGSMAVYLDDCASGTLVFGNIFCECSRAVFIGGGRDNRVENNVFVACDPSVQIDGRGMNPRKVWQDMVYITMKVGLEEMNADGSPFTDRYPSLKDLEPYYREGKGVPPEGNVVTRNISIGGPWLKIHWGAEEDTILVRENLVDVDPQFLDPASLDFRIADGSPAYALGFQRIPTERIGMFIDEDRTRLE